MTLDWADHFTWKKSDDLSALFYTYNDWAYHFICYLLYQMTFLLYVLPAKYFTILLMCFACKILHHTALGFTHK